MKFYAAYNLSWPYYTEFQAAECRYDTLAKSMHKRNKPYGMLAGSTLWGMYAGWLNSANAGILATKMGGLFPVKVTSANFIQITTLMGGLLGGLGAMTGSLLRGLLEAQKA